VEEFLFWFTCSLCGAIILVVIAKDVVRFNRRRTGWRRNFERRKPWL